MIATMIASVDGEERVLLMPMAQLIHHVRKIPFTVDSLDPTFPVPPISIVADIPVATVGTIVDVIDSVTAVATAALILVVGVSTFPISLLVYWPLVFVTRCPCFHASTRRHTRPWHLSSLFATVHMTLAMTVGVGVGVGVGVRLVVLTMLKGPVIINAITAAIWVALHGEGLHVHTTLLYISCVLSTRHVLHVCVAVDIMTVLHMVVRVAPGTVTHITITAILLLLMCMLLLHYMVLVLVKSVGLFQHHHQRACIYLLCSIVHRLGLDV